MIINNRVFYAGLLALAVIQFPVAHAQAAGQQASPAMPPEAYTTMRYNRSDEIKVIGKIEQVEKVDGKFYVWVRSRSVLKEGYGVQPGTKVDAKGDLWRVDGVNPEKLKAEDKARLVRGSDIEVSGHNSTDTECEPSCRINSRKLKFG
jgi:hypothetical protein